MTTKTSGQVNEEVTISELHHVGILVEDVDQTLDFLQNALGLELEESIDDPDAQLRARMLRCGPVQIELFERGDLETRRSKLGGAPARLDHVAFSVSDLDGALSRLEGAGAKTESDPFEIGPWRMAFVDSDSSQGVRLQVLQSVE